MKPRFFILAAALLFAGAVPVPAQRPSALVVEDIFGRRLNETNGLVLVDWEGYIANPAIEFFVVPPANAAFPARAIVTATEPRLYFNRPSQAGPQGPSKEIVILRAGKQSVLVSIFPDRDDQDDTHEIKIELRDARGKIWRVKLPVRVIDQDRKAAAVFPVTVDFSQDQTGFFKDEKRRNTVSQAARDWMEFFEGVSLDPVAAGAERTLIWNPDGFIKGKFVVNPREYTGYLLYAYGIESPALRSGGEPSSAGGFQSEKSKKLQVRRSGGVEIEINGNYNNKGWLVGLDEGEWWNATNLSAVKNDLYSIAHHEVGHAFFFNPANPLFARAKDHGSLEDKQLAQYLSGAPKVDKADHFSGTVDPVSRRGVFGYEYHGDMPYGRWLPTKSDLLFAQAIGYRLRRTSAFAPLAFVTQKLPEGKVGSSYCTRLRAGGGIPFYNWEIVDGRAKLPPGLRLDPFTGDIQGVPSRTGKFDFTVRVRDYQKQSAEKEKMLMLEVKQ